VPDNFPFTHIFKFWFCGLYAVRFLRFEVSCCLHPVDRSLYRIPCIHPYSLHMFLLRCLRSISCSAFVFPLVFPSDITDITNALTVFCLRYFALFLQVCNCVHSSCIKEFTLGWLGTGRVKKGIGLRNCDI